MADTKKKDLRVPSQARGLGPAGLLSDVFSRDDLDLRKPSPQVSTLPPQAVFQFQQQAPAQQANPDLGFLGNVGTILNILGGVTQSPEISAIGGGLLGIMQRQANQEKIKQANLFETQKFESSRARARQGFELAKEFDVDSPEEAKIAKLQFQQGDTKGGFTTLRKVAGGERFLRDIEARIRLKGVINQENFQRAAAGVRAGKKPELALKEANVKMDKQTRRAVKALAREQQAKIDDATSKFEAAFRRPPNERELQGILKALQITSE